MAALVILLDVLYMQKKTPRELIYKDRKNYYINDISLCIKNINPPGRYSDFIF